MSHQISTQQPAVVLRSTYVQLRVLLAAALVALVGMTVAVVLLATDHDGASTTSLTRSVPAASAAEFRLPSHARIHGGAPVPNVSDVRGVPGTRYDGGPEEGTRGLHAQTAAPGTRYDGGPDEGTSGPGR
jgi:hypothetical protein